MNIPLPSALANKPAHLPQCFIVVSGFEAERVGSLGVMSVAMTVHINGAQWSTRFLEYFSVTATSLFPSRDELSVKVSHSHPATQQARCALTHRIDEAITAAQRVHGPLPVILPHGTIHNGTCRTKAPIFPTMLLQRLRNTVHSLASELLSEQQLLKKCPEQGSLFATVMAQKWDLQRHIAQPLINHRLRPIVIATDASRSHRGSAIAAVSSTGEIIGTSCPKKNIHLLELEAIDFAVEYFSAKYPARKLIILSDSRYAVKHSAANVRWVRGHNGHGLNDIADRAARQHRNQAEGGFPDSWMEHMHTHLLHELRANLRHDPTSYFYEEPTQHSVSLVA